jgi:RES domain-containing protein
LATLEVLAGLQTNSPLPGYVLIPAEFDESLILEIELTAVPADWREHPPSPSTQQLGNVWIAEERSAVLRVPSALVPKESNYVLNPLHPDFSAIRLGEAEPVSIDPRVLK